MSGGRSLDGARQTLTVSSVIPGMRSADHVGFVVPDLEEAVSFFVEVLGAEEVFRIAPISDRDGDSMARKVGVHPRAKVRGAMLRFGPATNVEFLQYDVPGQVTEPPLASDVGAAHLAVFVDDMDAAADRLRSESRVTWVGEASAVTGDQPHAGLINLFCTTRWGMLLELVSYTVLPYEQETEARMWGPAPAWSNRT